MDGSRNGMPVPSTASFSPARVLTRMRRPLQLGARAAGGGEFLAPHRVEDHGVLEASVAHAGDRDREVRDAAHEVGGAVQRIDDPLVAAGARGVARGAAFLGEDQVLGVGLAQLGDDLALGGPVDLGHEVVAGLASHLDHVEPVGRARDDFARLAGRRECDVDHGMHRRESPCADPEKGAGV